MNILIILIPVAVVLFLISLLSQRDKSDRKSSPPASRPQPTYVDKPEEPLPGKIRSEEAPQRSLLESYPALREISYTPVVEGFSPMVAKNVSRDVARTVRMKIATMKSIPVNYFTLMNYLRNPESNAGQITSVVMTNPVFSAKILQTVNSAYFNLSEKVTSVGRAITLLGFNNVRALVFQDAFNDVIPKDQSGNAEIFTKTWTHSAVVSVCAGYLGQNLFRYSESELATIGLLHDIGKYFIWVLEPIGEDAADLPLLAREERRYGTNHGALGGLIADNWKLSDAIINSIEYHHHPAFLPPESIPEPYRKQCFVINLANLICKVLGYAADDKEILQIRNEYYELFNLKPDITEYVTTELIKKIEKTQLTVQSYITPEKPERSMP